MYSGFGHIRRIDEDHIGLRVTLEEGPAGLLRSDHAEFPGLRDLLLHLLHETQKGVPRLTWVAVDDSGVITEVRLVLSGIPLHATRDDSGGYLIVLPFTNVSRKLSLHHPRFREFEGYLLAALEHETPFYYVGAAEDFYTVDDMLPAPPADRPSQDGVVAAVAGGTDVSEERDAGCRLNNPSLSRPRDTSPPAT
jgi:hypothetical protein